MNHSYVDHFPPTIDPRALRTGRFNAPPCNDGGSAGLAAAATIYASSNVISWARAVGLAFKQRDIALQLIDKQKSDYNEIRNNQRGIITQATMDYVDRIQELLDDLDKAYPDIPEAAEYVPIDACCIQKVNISCNQSSTPAADTYSQIVNRRHEQNDIVRAIVFDPRFLVNVDMASMQISDLLRGTLPVGDVVEILTDNAELAALTGRIGNTKRTTARDLGISRLRSQAVGRAEHRAHMSYLAQTVSPLGRQLDLRDLMQTPAQRIALALTQAQLIQNSLQNKYNQLAQKAPVEMAKIQIRLSRIITRLQFNASRATMVNQFVPNYAAIMQPIISAVTDALSGSIPPASANAYFGQPGQQNTVQQLNGKGVNLLNTTAGTDRPTASDTVGVNVSSSKGGFY